jgi:hypothetical protein
MVAPQQRGFFKMAETNQIDMDKFPYKTGDVLANGTKVISVIKGNVKDTFAGYRCRVILGLNKQGKREYGDEVIVPDLDGMSDPHYFPGGTGLEQLEILSDFDARRVYYQPPDGDMECCTPEEFLEIAKGGNANEPSSNPEKTEEPEDGSEATAEICQGITKSGDPCKRKPVTGEKYCNAHLE